MIYIFNSAYRPLFVNNMLNTLFLPDGWINEYRYRLGQNIDEAIRERLEKGADVAVIFVDRYAEKGYQYHPVRLGKLISTYTQADQVFIRLRLKEFIYPKDRTGFQQELKAELQESNIPHLTNGDRQNEKDGKYVAHYKSIFDRKANYLFHGDAWVKCVDALSERNEFKSIPERQYIFAKVSICEHHGTQKTLSPAVKENDVYYELNRNQTYDLRLNYRYPIQKYDKSKTSALSIVLDETTKALSSTKINIDSLSNSTIFTFLVKKYPEETKGTINLSYQQAELEGQNTVLGPDRALPFRVVERKSFWPFLILAIVVYVVSNVVIGTNLPESVDWTIQNIWKYSYLKIIFAIFQTGAVCGFIWLLGKKIF